MKIKEMNYKQIDKRLEQLPKGKELRSLSIDKIKEMNKEVKALNNRKSEIKKDVEERKALLDKVAHTDKGRTIATRKIEENDKMSKKNDISSLEYRNGFMKTLLGQELSIEERAAFTHTTVNTDAVIPTELQDKIYSNMEEQHPILSDVNTLRTGTVISIAKHTDIKAGDAKVVTEGEANDDEENTFVNVTLAGKKFSKHIDISYELDEMSIPAFETYLVQEIGNRLGAAMAAEIVRQVKKDLAASNSFEVSTPGTLVLADVLKGMGELKGADKVNVYVNGSTLYGSVATLDDKHFGFLKGAQEGLSGQLLGNGIKVEDSLEDGDVLILDAKQFTWNEVKGITFETDRDIKKGVRTIAGHAIAGGTLTNDKAGALLTVGESA